MAAFVYGEGWRSLQFGHDVQDEILAVEIEKLVILSHTHRPAFRFAAF